MPLVQRTGKYIANDTNVSIIEMNNKRTIERIATIALAAFLVGVFCYQVAYGLSLTQVATNASGD